MVFPEKRQYLVILIMNNLLLEVSRTAFKNCAEPNAHTGQAGEN